MRPFPFAARSVALAISCLLALQTGSCGGDSSGPKILPPSQLTKQSGDAQTGAAGGVLMQPLVVRVTDANGNAVPGVAVAWAVTSGGGSVVVATPVSDTDGRARAAWTLGTTAGPNTLRVSVAGLPPVTFSATGTAGVAASFSKLSGDGQTGTAGLALAQPLVVRVTDANGNGVAGVTVAWNVASGGGSIAAATATTGADGQANAQWTLGPTAGANAATASVPGLPPVTFAATATARAATRISKLGGDDQSAFVGEAVPGSLAVIVQDSGGNPVPGTAVGFMVSGGGGSLTGGDVVSDSLGVARAGTWTLGPTPGGNTVTAAIAALPDRYVVFNAVGRALIAAVLPAPFGIEDTVVLRGRGLAGASVSVAGIAATVVASSDTLVRFVPPAGLPECTSPLPVLTLVIEVNRVTSQVAVASLGRPAELTLATGGHAVVTSPARAGCRFVLQPGTYGVALYTVHPPTSTVSGPVRESVRRAYALQVVAPHPAPSATVFQVRRAAPAIREPPDVWPPARRPRVAQAASCTRAPLTVGDTVRLTDAGLVRASVDPDGTSLYQVVQTSEHYQWLFRPFEYARLTPEQQANLASRARMMEQRAFPFLAGLLAPLPDLDGDGRLNIVMADISAWGYYGYADHYSDPQARAMGCNQGDFVWFSSEAEYGAGRYGSLPDTLTEFGTLVHEMTHWIDAESPLAEPNAWSWRYPTTEGLAMLLTNMWLYQVLAGLDWWSGNTATPIAELGLANSHCFTLFGYFGDGPTSYEGGCSVLRYAIQEAAREAGQPPTMGLRAALRRRSFGDIRPIAQAVGAPDRAEESWQGEYLLMHYADDYVSGVSPRLTNSSFSMRSHFTLPERPYPYPSFVANAGSVSSVDVGLGLPDAAVFELVVPTRTTFQLSPPAPSLAAALVRRQ